MFILVLTIILILFIILSVHVTLESNNAEANAAILFAKLRNHYGDIDYNENSSNLEEVK